MVGPRQEQVDVVHGPQAGFGVTRRHGGTLEDDRFEPDLGQRLHRERDSVWEKEQCLHFESVGHGAERCPRSARARRASPTHRVPATAARRPVGRMRRARPTGGRPRRQVHAGQRLEQDPGGRPPTTAPPSTPSTRRRRFEVAHGFIMPPRLRSNGPVPHRMRPMGFLLGSVAPPVTSAIFWLLRR